MKKNFKYSLFALALVWAAIVIFQYESNHYYLYLLLKVWREKGVQFLSYGSVLFLIFLLYFFYKKYIIGQKDGLFKISVIGLLSIFTTLFLIYGMSLYLIWQPAIYTGSPLIFDMEKKVTRELGSDEKIGDNNNPLVLNTGMLTFDEPLILKIKAGGLADKFKSAQSGDAFVNLLKMYLNSVLPIILTAFLAYIIGFIIRRYFLRTKLPEDKEGPLAALTLIAIGYTVLTAIAFILGWFDVLNTLSVRVAALVILSLSLPCLKPIVKNLFAGKILKYKYLSIESLLVFLTLISLFHIILGTFHDLPVGIDGARVYVKIVRDILVSGSLPAGYPPYNANLIQSFASLLTFGDIQAMMFSPVFHAILSLILIYAIGRKFLRAEVKPLLLMILVMGISAMTLFLMVLDHKTEFFALFYGLIGLYYFLDWLFTKDGGKFRLILSAIFLGMSLGAKITFLGLFAGMIAYLFYHFWKKTGALLAVLIIFFITAITATIKVTGLDIDNRLKMWIAGVLFLIITGFAALQIIRERKKALRKIATIFIFLFFAMLTLLPWAALHYTEISGNGKINLQSLMNGSRPRLDMAKLNEGLQCEKSTGYETDYGRYMNHSTGNTFDVIRSYLTLPWEMTINTLNPNSNTTDIGFILLTMLPFALIFGLRKKYRQGEFMAVLIITALSWLFWIITFPGVTWYALAALFLSYTIIAALWPDKKEDKLFYYLFGFLTIFSILQMNFFTVHRLEKVYLAIGVGVLEEEKFFDLSFPNYRGIIDTAYNEDYFIKNHKIIIKGGGSLEYFLLHGDEIILHDNYMEYINCVLDKHDGNGVEALKDLYGRGVRYIFISKSMFNDQRKNVSDHYLRAYKSLAPLLQKTADSDRIFFGEIPENIENLSATGSN